MTRIIIKEIIWDDWNLEHIKKHGISIETVSDVTKNVKWHKKVKNFRYLAVGRSGNRIITLIISRKNTTAYYLVTARDASKEERKKLYDKENI